MRRRPLPPDPEGMNNQRAGWACEVLARFRLTTGCDPWDALPDLLCNLMHLCDRDGTDFIMALEKARQHYTEETSPS